jgi:hypothetical protein
MCVHMRGVHRRDVNWCFLMVNVAAFDHEVIKTVVGVHHQVVQNDEPEQELGARNGKLYEKLRTFRIPP